MHKKRASAGTSKAPVSATAGDTQALGVDTDRRGKLPDMRIQVKFSDGCGYQYVQREAAHGTASLYGDTGVIGLHVVFEPNCFKCGD